MHISDLHIGKRVNEFSLVEEQKHILGEILELLKKEAVQGLLVAGDIYDKVIPSAEAVDIFDEFLFSRSSFFNPYLSVLFYFNIFGIGKIDAVEFNRIQNDLRLFGFWSGN